MHVSWWVGVDSAPWWHDLGPWGAVSTRSGIPAALAYMHAAGLSTRTSCSESLKYSERPHLSSSLARVFRLLSESNWCRSSSWRSWKHPWKRYLLMYLPPIQYEQWWDQQTAVGVLTHPGFLSLVLFHLIRKGELQLDLPAYRNQNPLTNSESQQSHPPTSLRL